MKKFLIIFFLFLVITLGYGFFIGSKYITVREYSYINNKISDAHHGLKIVHFSDLHYGTTMKIKELKKIVKEINLLTPDIIFFTGDLFDKNLNYSEDEISDFLKTFNQLKPEIAAYIIKGNYDYQDDYYKIIDETNFKLLNNTLELFYYDDVNPIAIIGLGSSLEKDSNIEKVFEELDDDLFTILLIHEPDQIKDINLDLVDLVLAGHSHNGQVRLPFIGSLLKINGAKLYYDEEYLIGNTSLYISGGLGTSRIPIRLFNPPSFNFYRLYNR